MMAGSGDSLILDRRTTSSEDETREYGSALAKKFFTRGGVLVLRGGLGAGKTQVARGLVEGLGGEPREVSSPTFPVMQEYVSASIPVLHFDWYRLESEDEVVALGWWECLEEGALVVVEWGDRFPQLLEGIGAAILDVHIREGDSRDLRLAAWEDRGVLSP
jgi:tRNA threonylcarbamoyladenosine biosynthesis protein TsaE